MAEGDLYENASIRFIEPDESTSVDELYEYKSKQMSQYIAIFNSNNVKIINLLKRVQDVPLEQMTFDISNLKDEDNIQLYEQILEVQL